MSKEEEEEQQRRELPTYDPIPDFRTRFVDDVGGGFALGLAGSSAFTLLTRGLRAVPARAPRAAGTLAAYFAAVDALDAGLSLARGKDDNWNGLAAGAASWAALGLRRGAPGAVLLCLGYGFEIMEDRLLDCLARLEDKPRQPQRTRPLPAAAPPAATAAGCFWAVPVPHGPPIEVKEIPAAGLGL